MFTGDILGNAELKIRNYQFPLPNIRYIVNFSLTRVTIKGVRNVRETSVRLLLLKWFSSSQILVSTPILS